MTGDVELCDDGRTTVKFKKGAPGDFPGGPVIKTSPSNAGGAVRFLAGELRSHMPPGQKKDQNIKLKQHCNKLNKNFKNGPHQKILNNKQIKIKK